MRRFKAGDVSAVEGLWMTLEEAALVKQELLARGTKTGNRKGRRDESEGAYFGQGGRG